MRRPNSLCLIGLLALSLVCSASQAEPSPAERLVGLLSVITSLHATFEQSSRSQGSQAGEIWLEKPNRFRLETVAPLSQTIVSDGDALWTYDRDLEQVIISTLSNRIDTLPILLLTGDAGKLVTDYRVDFFEDEIQQYFLLHPHDDQSVLGRLSITFEKGQPVSVGVDTATREPTIIDLKVVPDSDVSETLFQFALPAGVDVIDDRTD